MLAGPGSGKTRVLTHRIAYLIQYLGVRPSNILAVTFTNKAAREMKSRVEDLLGTSTQVCGWALSTASAPAFCAARPNYLPFSANFVIFDADDQETLVKRALKELNLDDKIFRPPAMRAAISNAKNNLMLPNDYPTGSYRDEVVQRVYKRYPELLIKNNAVDFDDLLL